MDRGDPDNPLDRFLGDAGARSRARPHGKPHPGRAGGDPGSVLSLNDAETGRRGYVLTGEANYLAQVDAATAKSSSIVRRLADLTQDNSTQQLNVHALKQVVNERLELLKQTAQLGRSGQDDAVRDLERRSGLAASTQLSKLVADMMAEENRLLDCVSKLRLLRIGRRLPSLSLVPSRPLCYSCGPIESFANMQPGVIVPNSRSIKLTISSRRKSFNWTGSTRSWKTG